MQLLIESYTADEAKVITESFDNGKAAALSGIFMQAETRNRNGRIYRLNEMQNAVQSLQESIKLSGGVLSEVDHPSERLSVNFSQCGGLITEIRMDGNNAVGKMKILDTPSGLIVKEVIKNGFRPGVSSRGAGNVGPDGVVEGFSLVTIDIVVTPSCRDAQPMSIYESLQDSKAGYRALSLAEVVKEDEKAQKYLTNEVKKYLKEILKY